MSQSESLRGHYRSFVADLAGALDANDQAAQVPGTSNHDSVRGQDNIDALIASMAGGQ